MGKASRSAKSDPGRRGDGAGEDPETGRESLSFEDALAQLEGVVARLEEGEMPLEEALETFESGVKLSRQCSTRLEEAERRIAILVADREGAGELDAVEFESDEDWDDALDDDDETVED